MATEKIPYIGKAASIEEQIKLLTDIGININDKESAIRRLTHVGYYRLSAYFKPIREMFAPKNPISFEKIWELYVFDRKLRLLALDAIERIEVALRVAMSETMSTQYGPYWYIDGNLFKNKNWHLEFMGKVIQVIEAKNHSIIRHYYNTYSKPEYPPSWMIIECLTFGVWSKAFYNSFISWLSLFCNY